MSTNIYTADKETRPWFKLYPADILSTEEAAALSNAAFGVHVKLMFRSWQDTGVPASPIVLCRMTHSDPREWEAIWAEIESLWPESDHGRRYNRFIEDLRLKTTEESERSKRAGRKSAESRAEKLGTANPRANQPVEEPAVPEGTATPVVPVQPKVPSKASVPMLTMEQQRTWRRIIDHHRDQPEVIEDLTQTRNRLTGTALDVWLDEQVDIIRFDED